MRHRYAQIDAAGLCVGESWLWEPSADPTLKPLQANDPSPLGKQWDGAGFVVRVKSEKELAAEALQAIDRDTGMTRTLRETLIAVATKVGADVTYLSAKEAAAAAERAKLAK